MYIYTTPYYLLQFNTVKNENQLKQINGNEENV